MTVMVFMFVLMIFATSVCILAMIKELIGHGVCIQLVHSARILKLRVWGNKRDLTQDAVEEEICVVMPGVIARFDGSDIQVTVRIVVESSSSEKYHDTIFK